MGRLFNDSEDGGIIVMAIATILTFTAVPLAAYLFPYVSSLFPDDEDEPRSIPSKVPFVGHLIGMVQHGPSYCGNITCVSPSFFFAFFPCRFLHPQPLPTATDTYW